MFYRYSVTKVGDYFLKKLLTCFTDYSGLVLEVIAQGSKSDYRILTALISRLNKTGIPIGLQLHGSLVKSRPLKSQEVILGNKTFAGPQQNCPFKWKCISC